MLDNAALTAPTLNKRIVSLISTHPVLFFNLLLLLLSTIIGAVLYYGTFSAGDAIYTFVLRGGDYGSNPFDVSYYWYTQINGRVGQALIASLFSILSYFTPTPESYPWWIISTLEIFFLLAVPVNIVLFFRRLFHIGWSLTIFLLIMVWGFWSFNDIIYSPSHMHQAIEGYYLPAYLISILFIDLLNKPFQNKGWAKWLFWGLIYFFLAIFGEQFFPTLPVLFIPILLANELNGNHSIKYWLKIISLFISLSLLSAIIFFISPGQIIRNSTMQASFGPILSIDRLAIWYQTYVALGYNFLFHWSHNMPIWWGPSLVLFDWLPNFNVLELHNYLSIFPLVVLVVSIVFLIKNRQNKAVQGSKSWEIFRLSLITTSFFAAYLACLSTLIVSDYFPVYAGIIPTLFLACGLCGDFILLFHVLDPTTYSKKGSILPTAPLITRSKDTRRIETIIFSIIMGIVFSLAVTNRLLFLWTHYYKIKTLVVTGLLLTPLFSAVAYYFILTWSLKRLSGYWNIFKVIWLILAILAGNYLWQTTIASSPLPSEWHTLTITATGDKNPRAGASEVWLQQILFGKNNLVPFSELEKTGSWVEKEGYLVSTSNQPATLTLKFRSEADKQLQLLFSEHPNAGTVLIKLDDQAQTVDLYDEGGDRVLILPIEGPFWRILLNRTEELSIGLIVFVLSIWLLASPLKHQWGKRQQRISLGIICFVVGLFCFVPNIQKSIASYQTFHLTQAVRQLTYKQILELYKTTAQTKYFLTDCPPKSYYNHYGFDANWSIKSYFLWVGYPEISVLVDQNQINRPMSPDINDYVKLKCVFPQ